MDFTQDFSSRYSTYQQERAHKRPEGSKGKRLHFELLKITENGKKG